MPQGITHRTVVGVDKRRTLLGLLTATEVKNVRTEAEAYLARHGRSADQRRADYQNLVTSYYDLVTDFYEYGWGQSFHFAPRARGETLRESIARHEHWLAFELALKPSTRALDVGCGVGGPMREIARFATCCVTGINNNTYQVQRARLLNEKAGLCDQCMIVAADFLRMPLPDASMDAAYAIEATVHAPDLEQVYREVRRVLRPGALFGLYEWCMTSAFNPDDEEHQAIKRQIEVSCGIPDMETNAGVLQALRRAGFDILETEDRAKQSEVPWWEPLAPSRLSFSGLRSSQVGARLTNLALSGLEPLGAVPKGTASIARVLAQGGRALVASGRSGTFTPAFFVLARA